MWWFQYLPSSMVTSPCRQWKTYAALHLLTGFHDDVIKWKHFPRNWSFVRGIHRSPVNSPHKCQWREALMFSLICAWINGWVNNREAGDLRCGGAHYDVIVMRTWPDDCRLQSAWILRFSLQECNVWLSAMYTRTHTHRHVYIYVYIWLALEVSIWHLHESISIISCVPLTLSYSWLIWVNRFIFNHKK